MAIDSESKRKSLVTIGFYPIAPGIAPDNTKPQGWRQAVGYSYYGINAAAPGGAASFPLVNAGLVNDELLVNGGLVT